LRPLEDLRKFRYLVFHFIANILFLKDLIKLHTITNELNIKIIKGLKYIPDDSKRFYRFEIVSLDGYL